MATQKKNTPKKSARKTVRPAKHTARHASKPVARKAVRKAVARKPAKKKAAKPAAARNPAPKPSRRPAAQKPAASKKGVKEVIAKKKPAAADTLPLPKPPAPIQIPIRKGKPARPFRKDELAFFRAQLQKQLDLIQGNLNALASDNLKRSPIEATGDISAHSTHMADQGTDNFDRELALNLASSRQDSIYDIEDAIRRIDDGTYGACEVCGSGIERARLKALPFAKKCMHCQNAAERGRTFYRPFSGTLPLQQLAADDAAAESPDSVN